jgi:hydrogenase nickel incorporation protein HypB
MEYFKRGVEILNPGVVSFEVSSKTGEGMPEWTDWLVNQVKNIKQVAG